MFDEPVGRSIGKLFNQIRRKLDSFSVKNGLSGTQGRIMHYILAQRGDDVFQKDIEEEFNLRPSTATGTLQLMERNGFILRESTEYDARLKRILITEKGAQMKKQVMDDVESMERQLIRHISQEDLDVFVRVLKQMSDNLK